VLDCDSNRDYLRKLGSQRLLYLKGKLFKNSWEQELEQFSEEGSVGEEYSPVDMMAVVGGRKIKERVLKGDLRTILAGIGISNLAAWLAYYDLKNEDYDIDLAAEIGFYGYAPRPGDPWIFNFYNIPTCKMATDIPDILGLIIGGENNRALGALGGGQIDKYGNVNSTKVPGEFFLVGSGGANDVASAAREVVVLINQSRGRYLEQVPYITYPGDRVRTLVSTMGVFEKLGDDKELTLTECFADPKLSTLEQRIKQVKEHCGWELKVAPKVKDVPPPTLDELKLLRLFDPKGYYLT
jgi:acyl CoA:acetate/3-ketoacid CoA transferase beta subunit